MLKYVLQLPKPSQEFISLQLDLDESGEESEDNAEPGVSENGREAENEIMDEPFDGAFHIASVYVYLSEFLS